MDMVENSKPIPRENAASSSMAMGKNKTVIRIGDPEISIIANNGIIDNTKFTNPVPIAEMVKVVRGK